jgi:beta-phosphoglucomutase
MTGKHIKAIIFDMDGVLVNTEPHHLVIEKRLFAGLGLNISQEEHGSYMGKSPLQMWSEVTARHRLSLNADELAQKNSDAIIKYFSSLDKIDLIPGVKNFLDKIFARGIPMALASSSDVRTIDLFLSKTGLDKYFLHKVSTETVGKSKPEPDVYLLTSKLLSVAPEECLVIEDSPNGIIAAKSAGMYCLAYKTDTHVETDQSMADESFSDFSLLPEILSKYLEL